MNNYIKKTIAMYSAEELKNIRFNIVAFSEDPALLFNEKDNVNTNGEKMSSICYKHAKENAPDLADGYLECPPHLFYTDDIGFAIRRVYGMAMTAEKAIVAQVVTAMTNHNNDVVGGIQLKDLVPYWLGIPCYRKYHLAFSVSYFFG